MWSIPLHAEANRSGHPIRTTVSSDRCSARSRGTPTSVARRELCTRSISISKCFDTSETSSGSIISKSTYRSATADSARARMLHVPRGVRTSPSGAKFVCLAANQDSTRTATIKRKTESRTGPSTIASVRFLSFGHVDFICGKNIPRTRTWSRLQMVLALNRPRPTRRDRAGSKPAA